MSHSRHLYNQDTIEVWAGTNALRRGKMVGSIAGDQLCDLPLDVDDSRGFQIVALSPTLIMGLSYYRNDSVAGIPVFRHFRSD